MVESYNHEGGRWVRDYLSRCSASIGKFLAPSLNRGWRGVCCRFLIYGREHMFDSGMEIVWARVGTGGYFPFFLFS